MDMLLAAQSSMAIHMGTGRRQDLSCGCCNQQGSACRIQLCAGTAGRREHRCCVVRRTQRVLAASDSGGPVSEGNTIFHRDRILRNCHGYRKLVIHIPIRDLGFRQSISPFCQLTEAEHAVFAAGRRSNDLSLGIGQFEFRAGDCAAADSVHLFHTEACEGDTRPNGVGLHYRGRLVRLKTKGVVCFQPCRGAGCLVLRGLFMRLRHRRIVQLIGRLRRDANLKRAFSVQSCPFIGNDLKCCDSGIVGNGTCPYTSIHHFYHGLLVNFCARGIEDGVALRRGNDPAQMNVELRTSVLCAKNILIAAAGQGVVHNKVAVLRLCFVGDLEQIVEVCTRFYEQTLLAPVVGAFRGDELFGVDRLGGDDGGVRVRRIHSTLGLMMMGMFMSKTIWKTAETTKLCSKFQTFASIHRSCSWNNLNLLIIPKSVHRKAYPTQGATGLRNGRNR